MSYVLYDSKDRDNALRVARKEIFAKFNISENDGSHMFLDGLLREQGTTYNAELKKYNIASLPACVDNMVKGKLGKMYTAEIAAEFARFNGRMIAGPDSGFIVEFDTEEDAVAFKLKWS
jgi:hypothetical protein